VTKKKNKKLINYTVMIKKFLLPILVLCAFTASAQLNNSWIDYNKTYYKFKIGADNICRIPQFVVASAGIGTTNADHFQLWRNGQQVRLYTSVTNTNLGSTDYIEFFGEMNDGKPDANLYRVAGFQLADRYSLETDTATYFLTVNTTGGNLRYASGTNPSPGAATADAYYMRTIDVFYKNKLNRGFAIDYGAYVHSSSYDNGEGYTSTDIPTNGTYTENITGLNLYTAGPTNSLTFKAKYFGNTYGSQRKVEISIGTNLLPNSITSANLTASNYNPPVQPISLFANPASAAISFKNVNPFPSPGSPTDNVVIASMSINYPATFNFNNTKSFAFSLAASATGNFLLIDNFNFGTSAPILYDITEGKRYVGDITYSPGKVKFVLPASSIADRKFILNNIEAANIKIVNTLTTKNFINYNTTATRGDYIIISNPVLFDNGSGLNYVDQYRAYRSSNNGGSYNAKVYDINELTDQFAFGIKKHPSAIRDFVRFIDAQYPIKPKFVFLIGRGMTYQDTKPQESNPLSEKLNLVPTFGWPASDVLLVSQPGNATPIAPVGRLGAVTPAEVNVYLQKVLEYEAAQQLPSNSIGQKAWMKNAMHIIGGKTDFESLSFKSYMDNYKSIYEDTLMGGKVETFLKTSTATIQQASSERISQLFQEGLGFITYFGHSSATTFEFNLSDPSIFNNAKKYPFFNASGCTAGNFFNFDVQRLNTLASLSDIYVLANQRGSIGFLASSHFGIPDNLDVFNIRLYKNISLSMYGKSIGEQMKETYVFMGSNNPAIDYATRVHIEELNLHGDPAIKINTFAKPDYVIEQPSVKINPSIITVADASFNLQVEMRNIGKATKDSIRVNVKRLLPNTTVPVTIKDTIIFATKFMDTLKMVVPINPATDKGQNKLIVKLDWTNKVDELFENNNEVSTDFFIFENSIAPVHPYNFSIINTQNITFTASTANPLVGNSNYTMELDTTELFNSPFKKTYTKSGVGGVIEFVPTNLTFTDSTVYYWRTSVDAATPIWNNSSFVYLPASSDGFNMSHYFQDLKNTYNSNINVASDRTFKFNTVNSAINVSTGNFPPNDFPQTNIAIGSFTISNWGNTFNTLQFTVIDGLTASVIPNTAAGAYGSNPSGPRPNQFEFPFNTTAQRNTVVNFLNAMPNNAIIIMYPLLFNPSANAFVSTWQADPAGANGNLYTKLKNYGFTQLDSFYRNIPMIFKFSKDNSSPSFQKVGTNPAEILTASLPTVISYTNGEITSPKMGPAKSWDSFHWRGKPVEALPGDSISFNIIGVTNAGIETTLYTIDSTIKDFDISTINAVQYPYLKTKMYNSDKSFATPYQLRYWRLNYTPVPEGAVAPNVLFTMKDTVDAGDSINFSVAFKNVSKKDFASTMKIGLRIKNNSNVDNIINVPNGKVLLAGDTMKISYSIPSQNFIGNNTLFLDVNPNNDQPEQYHPNNILYKDFFVKADEQNPLMDVTFDGIHILSRDIVSSKPNILIKLKDENRFLALKDTALMKVQLRYPGEQNLRNYKFGTDTLRFNPANLSAGENTATINFNPSLPRDGDYELVVSGKDVSGNKAGALDYRVVFTVINKSMISEMLNYPNPFTTSTAFVFTLTGTQVPQNLRIQILTITGKVVKEITKEDLTDIHIGRNITNYKWDGTDMYGQALANGVYIYRVITNQNGESLERYKADTDDTGKYFNKGYGKMYLMR
jgi:hypothetical protein